MSTIFLKPNLLKSFIFLYLIPKLLLQLSGSNDLGDLLFYDVPKVEYNYASHDTNETEAIIEFYKLVWDK